MYMASDAVSGRIFFALEEGEPLPEPSDIKSVRLEKKNGFISLVYIDTEDFKADHEEKPVKKKP
jgi:hypothetical protein